MSFVISSSVFLFSSLLNSSSLPPRWFLCLFHCLLFFLSIFLPAGLLVAAAAAPVPAVEPFLFLWTAQSHTKVLCHLSLPLFFLFGNTSPPPFSWGHISVCTVPTLGGSHLGGLRPGKGDNRNYTSTACIPRYSGNIQGHFGIVHTGWHGAGCPRGIGCSDNSPWSQGWAHPRQGVHRPRGKGDRILEAELWSRAPRPHRGLHIRTHSSPRPWSNSSGARCTRPNLEC